MKKIWSIALLAFMASCASQEEPTDTGTAGADTPEEMSAGKKLFVSNCVQCHSIKSDKIGPKLEGSLARWDNDTARIYAFIWNSQESIKKGDPRALKVYDEWNEATMTPMVHLSGGEIAEIMDYINKGEE